MSNVIGLAANTKKRLADARLSRFELKQQFHKARAIIEELRRRQIAVDEKIAKLSAELKRISRNDNS